MSLENGIDQLILLLLKLTPVVDKLVVSQMRTDEQISSMIKQINNMINMQTKQNMVLSELRTSNYRLAEAIDKLVNKIDKVDQFEERLRELEEKR